MQRRTILQSALGLAVGTPLAAALNQGKLDAACDALQQASDSKQVSAACLYVRQGETVVNQNFGAATDADAIFLLASITKPIAIAAVMSLYDQQDFRLEDPVQKFIPEFSGDGRERIQMQHLFTHISGLPDQLPENQNLRTRHAPLSEFVERAIRTPLLFAPASKYRYSSMGILLACEVARRISGKPIAELPDQVVFKPLRMTRSALGVGKLDIRSLVRCQVASAAQESGSGDSSAKSWDWNSDYWRKLGTPWGGAHASTENVARFLSAFLHPQSDFLKPDTARMMIQNHHPAGMHPRGLGFDVGKSLGGPAHAEVFGHSGATGTLCWADPKSDSVFVVLTTLPAGAAKPHPRTIASEAAAQAIL